MIVPRYLVEKKSCSLIILLTGESNSIRVEEQENIVYTFVMLLYICLCIAILSLELILHMNERDSSSQNGKKKKKDSKLYDVSFFFFRTIVYLMIGSCLSPIFFLFSSVFFSYNISYRAHIFGYVLSSSDELVDLLFSHFPLVCIYIHIIHKYFQT
jgi:ABC-type Fe3+ transport system permease subunit